MQKAKCKWLNPYWEFINKLLLEWNLGVQTNKQLLPVSVTQQLWLGLRNCIELQLSLIFSFQSLDLESHEVEDEEACVENPNLYDPRFFLLLFSQICSAESYVDRHLKLIEAGVLSLALACLSSKDEMMRCAGATLLSRVYSQV